MFEHRRVIMASATTSPSVDPTSEVAILGRLLAGSEKTLTRELATHFLRLEFSDPDKGRMHDLAVRNQADELTEAEREEMLSYAKAGCLLGILQSRARRFLKAPEQNKAS